MSGHSVECYGEGQDMAAHREHQENDLSGKVSKYLRNG